MAETCKIMYLNEISLFYTSIEWDIYENAFLRNGHNCTYWSCLGLFVFPLLR